MQEKDRPIMKMLQMTERKELYLRKILGENVPVPSSVTRVEHLYDAIINETTPLDPVTRIEHYLAKIAGADVPVPYPVTREEHYLAAIAGMNVITPTPFTRYETYLEKWLMKSTQNQHS